MMNKKLLSSLFLLTAYSYSTLHGQDDNQGGGGESAAESSVSGSSSEKKNAVPESLESNPVVTVVRAGIPFETAKTIQVANIISVAKAGGSVSNLIKVSKKIQEVTANPTGKTKFLDNLIAAANSGITFTSAEELDATISIIESQGDAEFTATTLNNIKSNQDNGVSIVVQKKIGIDKVATAISNGDNAETVKALYDQVLELESEGKTQAEIDTAIESATKELADDVKATKSTIASSIEVSSLSASTRSSLNLAVNALLSNDYYIGNSALQTALINAATVATEILTDEVHTGSISFSPQDVYDVSKLTSSGYNTELIKLLIKYGAIGDKGSSLATGALSGFSETSETSSSLSDFLSTTSSTSDYLGLLSTLTGDNGIGDADGDDNDFLNSSKNTVLDVSMDKVSLAPAANISLGSKNSDTTVDVSSILTKAENHADRKILILGAAKDLTIAGDTKFTNANDVEDHALVLGAADELYFRSEYSPANSADYANPDPISLEYTGSNLGLGSESEMRLVNVNIKTGGNLAIASLDKLLIGQDSQTNMSTFSVGTGGKNSDPDNIYMYANNLIKINGLAFAGNVDDVYMDAITIDLANVTFPENSEVMARSRDGTINNGIGSVKFGANVYHGSDILTGATGSATNEFNGKDGEWDLNKKIHNGKSAFVIRKR